MEKIYATIITIGDELLIGQVVDTNSAWMAQRLNETGILLKKRISIGDDAAEIEGAVDAAAKEGPVVLITGGLGPTADDITKPVLCRYFQSHLVMNEEALENVKNIFARFNRPLTERNIKQAEVPANCRVIQNSRGTAPGMWFEKNGVVFVSMPGVPHEMKGMMQKEVLPALEEKFRTPVIEHRTLVTAGIGESFLADMIQEWEEKLPAHLKLAYLPNYGIIRLRITGISNDREQLIHELNSQFSELQQLVQRYFVSNRDEPLELTIARLLREKGKTAGTAESCTGGYLAHLFTQHPGASKYFWGSVVSYDNTVKEHVLNVPVKVMMDKGTVSEEVATYMAKNALDVLGVDYSLAVTGIFGPDGGSEKKPAGMIWIAAATREKLKTLLLQLPYDRERNLHATATYALNLLRELIVQPAD